MKHIDVLLRSTLRYQLMEGFVLHRILVILFLSAFLLTYLLTPLVRSLATKLKILDYPSNARKIHTTPTPLLGGIAIFLSFLLCMSFLFLVLQRKLFMEGPMFFSFGNSTLFWIQMGVFMFAALFILLTGILDDIKMIDFRIKLFSQALAAAIVISCGMYFKLTGNIIFDVLISFAWIVVITNSFNLLDNMNGLSTSIASITALLFTLSAFMTQAYLLTLIFFMLFGAFLGFLPFNFPKAKIFLGDTGSLFLGFTVASFSILLFNHVSSHLHSFWLATLLILLLMSIPILDTLCVTLIRTWNHKPIYIGDTNHLSHQLVKKGISPTYAVLLLASLTGVIGITGILFVT